MLLFPNSILQVFHKWIRNSVPTCHKEILTVECLSSVINQRYIKLSEHAAFFEVVRFEK
jgi:hypothetical protein